MSKAYRLIEPAAKNLSRDQRLSLLAAISESTPMAAVAAIVGNDCEVQRALLKEDRLRPLHLAALAGKPDDAWVAMAIAALDAGYKPDELVTAAYGTGQCWSSESDMWQEWIDCYARLQGHPDSRVREIARIGQERCAVRREDALKRDRFAAVHGILHRPQ